MSQENVITKALNDTVLSRRTFLKWSGALGGTAVLAGGLNFGLKATAPVVEQASTAAGEGQWITAACWHNCGGRCLVKAEVVDGVVRRVKTDDTHLDTPDFPQQRACVRGRAQRKLILGADRLKYPMIRKNWAPGGGQKELRGRDEWVRISWDEALDIYASEVKRVVEKYGNTAIFAAHDGQMGRPLSLYGGYVTRWGSVSWGTWREAYEHFTGIPGTGDSSGNDRLRLRKARLIVMWGANPAVSSNGNPAYNYMQAKRAGAKFIFIDPIYSDTARVLADEWIPIRPATDATMLLGMAHHLIANDLHDQAFLDKYCVGFDAEHMPDGADPKDNFKDYVLGTYDGTPKTPEWASEICGVPPETIRRLATELAGTKPAVIQTAGAPARTNNSEYLPQVMLTVAWMTGNTGIQGSGCGPNMHNSASNAGPSLVRAGGAGVPGIPNPLVEGGTRQGNINALNNCEMWNAILTGKYTAGEHGEQPIDIKMIVHGDFGDALNQRAGLMKGIEAHRKVEFVVAQTLFLNTSATYSDLVLPVTSQWERYGGFQTGNREILIFNTQVIDPVFEAKDDLWIARELGQRLGLDPLEIDPLSDEQRLFNQIAGATVMKEDASGSEPLVTITEDDIREMGVVGEPQVGRISYREFRERGIYQVPRSLDDNFGHTELEAFIADPVANPTATASGKLEIYSTSISEWIEKTGFNSKDPLPKYDPPIEGYEGTFDDWERGQKGQYPLQLVTMHYQRRSHSSFDNIPWLREMFPQELMMNPVDAMARGIENGDISQVSSRHGTVIRPTLVTERVMPGVIILGQGAWAVIDPETGIDIAGCTNTLNGDHATGQGHTGHNSCNVEVTKYEGSIRLEPDHRWPQRIVFEEA